MPYCSECGSAVEAGGRYCQACGKPCGQSVSARPAALSSDAARSLGSIRFDSTWVSPFGAMLLVVGMALPVGGNQFTGGIWLATIGRHLGGGGASGEWYALILAALVSALIRMAVGPRPISRAISVISIGSGLMGLLAAIGMAVELSSGQWGVGIGSYAFIAGFALTLVGGLDGIAGGAVRAAQESAASSDQPCSADTKESDRLQEEIRRMKDELRAGGEPYEPRRLLDLGRSYAALYELTNDDGDRQRAQKYITAAENADSESPPEYESI